MAISTLATPMTVTLRSQVLFLNTLAFMAKLVSACATVPQVKPAGAEPFLKEWVGTWQSSISPASGEVDLTITRLSDNSFSLGVKLTDSRFGSWTTAAAFKDGVLVVERSSLQMELRLHRDGHLEATYDVSGGDRGYWVLRPRSR